MNKLVPIVAGSVVAVGSLAIGVVVSAAPAPGDQVPICHRTDDVTMPYVFETPDVDATGIHDGHADHTGPIFMVGDTPGTKWGDIIPPINEPGAPGNINFPNITFTFDGLNATEAGLAILENNCAVPGIPPTTTTTAPTTTTTAPTTTTVPVTTTTTGPPLGTTTTTVGGSAPPPVPPPTVPIAPTTPVAAGASANQLPPISPIGTAPNGEVITPGNG